MLPKTDEMAPPVPEPMPETVKVGAPVTAQPAPGVFGKTLEIAPSETVTEIVGSVEQKSPEPVSV